MKKVLTIEKTLFICTLAILALIIWVDHFTNIVNLMVKFFGLNDASGESVISTGIIVIVMAVYLIAFGSYKKKVIEKDNILMNFSDICSL